MKKTLISLAAALGFIIPVFAFLPAQASAQTPTTGLLNVYVQVINQSGVSYSPSNFTVAVSGNSPSPSTFVGSQSGTLVSLNPGAYAATVTNTLNYTPTYSVGCDSTIAAGQTQTCVITMNWSSYNYGSSYIYPYAYQQVPFTCRTDTPTVGLGQTARFTAVGGVGGTYNWMTASQNYPNIGPVLTTTFQSSGTQTVSVTNAAQTATCPITVTTSYYPQPVNTVYPTYNTYPVYTAYSYPRYPNTGLEPIQSAQIAFALVLLLGAAIAAYPYARKSFAITVR